MTPQSYDIFRKDYSGEPVWVEAVASLERAKLRMIELAALTPGQYTVLAQGDGHLVSTVTTVTSTRSHTASNP